MYKKTPFTLTTHSSIKLMTVFNSHIKNENRIVKNNFSYVKIEQTISNRSCDAIADALVTPAKSALLNLYFLLNIKLFYFSLISA